MKDDSSLNSYVSFSFRPLRTLCSVHVHALVVAVLRIVRNPNHTPTTLLLLLELPPGRTQTRTERLAHSGVGCEVPDLELSG